MVKFSGIYLTQMPRHGPLNSVDWMCVEDPF